MQRPPIEQQITFLRTADLAMTAGFYESVLGLPLILDQGSCRIYRTGGTAFVGFCRHLEAPALPQGIILTLVSGDVDGWYRYLQEHGVIVERAPAHNPRFNIYHFFFRDPNGYLIEIQQFLDPAWPNI